MKLKITLSQGDYPVETIIVEPEFKVFDFPTRGKCFVFTKQTGKFFNTLVYPVYLWDIIKCEEVKE